MESAPYALGVGKGQHPQGWISSLDKRKQMFCNRSLDMKSTVAVGFDMDCTLAQYKAETFETLAYKGTVRKLVYDLGYPKEILDWKFDWRYMMRLLVPDEKRGNILKMDRHKHVKVAYHGFTAMFREDRASTYGNGLSRESIHEPDHALIDTLSSMAKAHLFAQLVELKDSSPEKVPPGSNYSQMYTDVRAAVDLCHRDGTLKEAVASDHRIVDEKLKLTDRVSNAEMANHVEQERAKRVVLKNALEATYSVDTQEYVKEMDKLEEQQLKQQQPPLEVSKHQRSKRFPPVPQGRRVQTLAGYTAMIVMYTRTGRYKEAEEYIQEMDLHGVIPDKSNWLARLSAYGQQGKLRDAERVFKGLQESSFSVDAHAFNYMILFYGKARMYEKAFSTFQNMIEAGGNPDEGTYRSMIGACGKAGKLKDALNLFAEMKRLNFRPTVQNYNTLISLYGKARSASGILRTIEDMKDAGCKPDGKTLDACLRALERSGKLSKTLNSLLQHLRDADWSEDAASYSPLLNAYLKSGMLEEALETFRLMRKALTVPKEGLCRELITQCKQAGKLAEAEYVFSEIEAVGITPSLETVCSMIHALGLMEKIGEAERLYNSLRTSGRKLDIVVYNVMINVYMRVGAHQSAARIFESVEQHPDVVPDSYTFHGMLRVYQKAGLCQEAVEFYWKMVQQGIELDEEMLNCVINCCGRALPLDETSRLFQAMLEAGFSPNSVTFNLMIDIYGKAGMLERACETFDICRSHGKLDNITYSTLINLYGKQRDFAKMEATAWEMRQRTMKVGGWVEAYNSMLDAYGKAGSLIQMEGVLDRMQEDECHGDMFTHNILINIYGKKGLTVDLESVLEQMEKDGRSLDLCTYNTLIGIYGQAEGPDRVMGTFKQMHEAGLVPDRITYKSLVAAFEKSGNLWEAARWSLWMTQAGHATDVTDVTDVTDDTLSVRGAGNASP